MNLKRSDVSVCVFPQDFAGNIDLDLVASQSFIFYVEQQTMKFVLLFHLLDTNCVQYLPVLQ